MEIGYSVICFGVYLVVVVLCMLALKKSIITSLLAGWIVLLFMSGRNFAVYAVDSVKYSFTQENEFALIMFGLMGFLMERTGMVGRIVNILNSIFGRLRGGAGYVNVLGSAAYGVCAGSVMGGCATIGAVTIPWMNETGFSREDSSIIATGNAGLTSVIPPSSSFAIILSWPIFVSMGLTSGKMYLAGLICGFYLVILRLVQSAYIVRRAGIPKPSKESIPAFGPTFRKNWTGLTMFLGTIIPVMVTTGALNTWLKAQETWGSAGNGAVSLMTWLPMMICVVIIIEGWAYLPHSISGWAELLGSSIGRFKELGSTLLLGYFAARVLSKMGLAEEMGALFASMNVNKLLLIFVILAIIFLAAGPLSPTVIMNSIGPIAFSGLIAAGVNPYAAGASILGLATMGSCIPPSTPALYVAGGIAGLEDVKSCFKDLIFLYAVPSFILVYFYCVGIIPGFVAA